MPAITDAPRLALLPLKLTIRGAGLAFSIARGIGSRLAPPERRREHPPAPPRSAAPRTPAPQAPPAPQASTASRPAPAPPAPEPPAPEPPAPAHVDREAVLVAESADPGAADGAGASVHVSEPWDNYAKLNADEIIDRLAAADASSIAAVRLYEASHRKRRTVLEAADRRLAGAGR